MKITPLHILFSFFLLQIIACDSKKDERNNIIAGKWHIQGAEKDGQAFNALEGTVFDFTAEGKLTTNVPQLGEGAYHFDKSKIVHNASSKNDYEVELLTPNELILSTLIRNSKFKMFFGRDSIQ